LCHRFLAGWIDPPGLRGSRDRRASVSRHPQVSRLCGVDPPARGSQAT
jgi:hypothetical protein